MNKTYMSEVAGLGRPTRATATFCTAQPSPDAVDTRPDPATGTPHEEILRRLHNLDVRLSHASVLLASRHDKLFGSHLRQGALVAKEAQDPSGLIDNIFAHIAQVEQSLEFLENEVQQLAEKI